MNKRYFFNVNEFSAIVTEGLRPYIGVATDFCNHLPIVESVVYSYLYGYPIHSRNETITMIRSYSVPTDVVENIVDTLSNQIERLLKASMGELNPENAYDCHITPYGDLIVVEMNKEPPPVEEQLMHSILEGIERGDYYPERIRKLVGF